MPPEAPRWERHGRRSDAWLTPNADTARKNRGRQRPPQLALGLPPPLERRKEYYEQVVPVEWFSPPRPKQSMR